MLSTLLFLLRCYLFKKGLLLPDLLDEVVLHSFCPNRASQQRFVPYQVYPLERSFFKHNDALPSDCGGSFHQTHLNFTSLKQLAENFVAVQVRVTDSAGASDLLRETAVDHNFLYLNLLAVCGNL